MKRPFSLLLSLTVTLCAAAQWPYALSAVPEHLKKDATVITHLQTVNVTVEDLEKSTVQVRKLFTVLNEEGRHALVFNEYTTRFLSLEDAEIKVYDQNGRQLHRIKKKEMTTQAVGEGLIEDGYVTYYAFSPSSYPVTMEFTYEWRSKSTLSFPDFRYVRPQEAVVESNFTATVPKSIKLRYKSTDAAVVPQLTDAGTATVYKWSVKNLAPIEDEPGSAEYRSRFPYVQLVPEQFSHYGFQGDLSSWKSFGNWMNGLYAGLDELPPARKAFFQQLVGDAKTEEEKMRRIYRYLQENFRYVSIQLGIGGFRPFSASFTDEKKYGDCKALSNYMKAALKAVGIQSHVAIINAGHNSVPVDPSFPANGFNHVILCVPGKKDSTWLECTSNTAAFGELGTFTENRNALLVTDAGGVLVPTPGSRAGSNRLSTHTTVALDNDLSATTETTITTTGEFAEMMAEVLKEKRDDQKETVVHYFGYKQPDDFLFTAQAAGADQTSLKLSLRKLSEFNAGNKHFIRPRVNKLWTQRLPAADVRRQDYYFRYPFEKHDTAVFRLTPGMKADVLPTPKELSNAYGSYQSRCWYNATEHAVYTATTLVLKQHRIPAAEYKTVKAFFDGVIQDDNQRIVLLVTDTAPAAKKGF